MKQNKKNNYIKSFKMIVFLVLVLLIARVSMIIWGNGKVNALEGYLYSFAATATCSNATSSNATSSNATACDATSSNATSSNATTCDATSSDATSSNVATSCDATSSNATSSKPSFSNEAVKQQQHLQEIQQIVEEKVEEPKFSEIVTYKNTELTSTLLAEIAESSDVKKVIINADDNSKISLDLFKTIQNTDKQLVIVYKENELVFEGENINKPRDIDVSIDVKSINYDNDILSLLSQDGLVINFAPNGELPGIAKVRIKATSILKNNLKNTQIYAYYYDEINKNFTLMTQNVKLSDDGYYEFAIEHNSKYILVNQKIEDRLLAGYIAPTNKKEEKEVVSFLESHKTYVVIIGICVLAILLITIIVAVDKRRIKKRKIESEQRNSNKNENIPRALKKDDE